MADRPQDASRYAGHVVRRTLRRNIAIDAETAQLVADAVQAALRAGAPARPPRRRLRIGPRGTTERKVPARSDRCGQYRCSGRSTGRDRYLALIPPGISRMNVSAAIKLVTCRNSR